MCGLLKIKGYRTNMTNQILLVNIVFSTKHSPENNPKHLAEVAENYLLAKGIQFNKEGLTITI